MFASISIFLVTSITYAFLACRTQAFDEMPPMDPAISTQSPHQSHNSDSCVGQCAFVFIDRMSAQLGTDRSAGLLNLNYNDFLAAFANATFFETFCTLYHEFNHCYTKCPHGYMQELLARSAEIVDHFCVWNYKAIMEHFGCLAGLDRNMSKQCLRTCSGHNQDDTVTSMMENFKHLALNDDPTESERYLAESCEYVTCTLHCDMPAIYHLCGLETAELVVNLTRKSFESMQRMALDTGALRKWPEVCADIRNYTLPKAPSSNASSSGNETNKSRTAAAWELNQRNGMRIETEQQQQQLELERERSDAGTTMSTSASRTEADANTGIGRGTSAGLTLALVLLSLSLVL